MVVLTMEKLDLRIRDLETGEVLLATFENAIEAVRWLLARPKGQEVLGVATHGLPKEVYGMLKEASRPLDDEELEASRRYDEEEEAKARALEEESRRQDREDLEAYREAQRTADVDRPMALEWSLDHGLVLADPFDPREITQAAREAVEGWVRERDEWVKDRGMVVNEASVTVWPGKVPDGEDRVHPGGQFFPATAPKKG